MGISGSLEKLKIFAYSKSNYSGQVGEFTAQINPDKYTHTSRVLYNRTQAQGSNGGSPDFNRIPSEVVTFELVFDGTGVVPAALPGVLPFTGDGIIEQLDALKKLVFTYNGKIHSPNYLKLSWGTLLFKCRLGQLTVTYTMFKPDGTPLRARARAVFVGFTDEVELAKLAKRSSPDMTHVVTVKAGDTLPLLCYRVYGESRFYLQVAAANDLTNFRDLRAGTQLVFPKLAEAVS